MELEQSFPSPENKEIGKIREIKGMCVYGVRYSKSPAVGLDRSPGPERCSIGNSELQWISVICTIFSHALSEKSRVSSAGEKDDIPVFLYSYIDIFLYSYIPMYFIGFWRENN